MVNVLMLLSLDGWCIVKQICNDEYPRYLSLLLWLQCQVSVLIIDLTMVLGIAIALNALLGLTMVTGVFLTVAYSVLFLMVLPHLGLYMAEVFTASIMAVVLFCFSVEVFHSNAALAPAIVQGLIPRLKGEMLYIAAGILGANIVPPNFYLHSALVQDEKGTSRFEPSMLLHHNVVDIATGWGITLLVNLAVLISAAAMFHNSGHVIITLQDAQALLEQILSTSGAPAAFGFALFCAEQLSSHSLAISGQVATEGFLHLKLSFSFHRVFTRLGAALVATCLVWSLGSEGTFQVLIFSQLLLALQLPFAVVPLLKVTSSEAVMGRFKNSPVVESISWICIGLIYVMNVWVAYDMFFGESDEFVESGSWNLMRDLVDSSVRWREAIRVLCLISVVGVMTVSTLLLSSMISAPFKGAESQPSYASRESTRVLEGSHTYGLQEGGESLSPDSIHVPKAFLPQDSGTGYHRLDTEYKEGARVGTYNLETGRMEAEYHEPERVEPGYDEAPSVGESPLTSELINESLLQDIEVPPARANESPSINELISETLPQNSDITDIKSLDRQCEMLEAPPDQQATEEDSLMKEPNEVAMSLAAQGSQEKLASDNLDQAETAASVDGSSIVASFSSLNSTANESIRSWVESTPESATEADTQVQPSAKIAKDEATQCVKMTVEDVDLELLDKDDYDLDGWEALDQDDVLQDSLSVLGESVSSLTLEEPVSGRSFSARSDVSEGSCGGSGSGSLSRLSGLGRAARRQFAALLDEFWGKLYDLHGQPASQAREKARRESTKAIQPEKLEREAFDVNSTWYTSRLAQKSWQKNVKAGGNDAYMHLTYSESDPSFGGNDPSFLKHSPAPDLNERRYSSLRYPSFRDGFDNQPATIHGYKMELYAGRSGGFLTGMDASSYLLDRQRQLMQHALGDQALPAGSFYKRSTSTCSGLESSFPSNSTQSYFAPPYEKQSLGRPLDNVSLANKLSTQTDRPSSYASSQYNPNIGQQTSAWDPLVYRATGGLDIPQYDQLSMQRERASLSTTFPQQPIGERDKFGTTMPHNGKAPPLSFDELSPSQSHKDAFSIQSTSPNQSLWATQPFELFGSARMPIGSGRASSHTAINQALGSNGNHMTGKSVLTEMAGPDHDIEILNLLRSCIRKLLKLDGSDWLFRLDSGSDEDLIGAVASREKVLVDADTRDLHRFNISGEQLWPPGFQRPLAKSSSDVASLTLVATGVPHCGEGCVWNKELLISFGVWCIHRVLELALMESRPELWGKYTYVLNRLQGVLDLAFWRTRTVSASCICLISEVPNGQGRGMNKQGSPPNEAGMGEPLSRTLSGGFVGNSFQGYPQSWPWGRNSSTGKGKGASPSVFLDIIKDVETAIGSRKGRTGTAAGDVAFPKGKENLASVLKRYKRRLGNKGSGPVANDGSGPNSGKRRAPLSSPSVFG